MIHINLVQLKGSRVLMMLITRITPIEYKLLNAGNYNQQREED